MLNQTDHLAFESQDQRQGFDLRNMVRAIVALFIVVGVASIAFVSQPGASLQSGVAPEPASGAATGSPERSSAPAAAPAGAEPAWEAPSTFELQHMPHG